MFIRFSTISEKEKLTKAKASSDNSMEKRKEKKSEDGRIDTNIVYDDHQNKAKLTDPEYRKALIAEVEKQRKEREENAKRKQNPQITKREDILEQILKLSGIKKGSASEKFVFKNLFLQTIFAGSYARN